MRKLARIYGIFEEAIPVLLFLSIFLAMTYGVVTRYIFGVYGSWIVEYSSYAFVWLSFVGAPYVRKLGAHIKIEILYATVEPKLSPAVRLIIWLIKEIAVIAYLLLLVRLGYELASRSANFRSQAMQLSQFWLYISAALGGAMFLIREIPGAYQQFRKGFSEPTTHILVDPTL